MAHSPRGWELQDQGNIPFSVYSGSHSVYTVDPIQCIRWITVGVYSGSQSVYTVDHILYSGSQSVYTVDHSQFIQWVTVSLYGRQFLLCVDRDTNASIPPGVPLVRTPITLSEPSWPTHPSKPMAPSHWRSRFNIGHQPFGSTCLLLTLLLTVEETKARWSQVTCRDCITVKSLPTWIPSPHSLFGTVSSSGT